MLFAGAVISLHKHSDSLKPVRQLYASTEETVQVQVQELPCTTDTFKAISTVDKEQEAESQVISNKDKVYPSRNDLVYYVPARGRRDRSGAAAWTC